MKTKLSVKQISVLYFIINIAFSGYLYGQVKFESKWFFNENTGNILYDSIMKNNGQNNGPVWVSGKFASALQFDGNNDSVG